MPDTQALEALLVEYSDDDLLRIAHIIGPTSAASMAMAERDRRRASGEDAVVYRDANRGVLLVGPRIAIERQP